MPTALVLENVGRTRRRSSIPAQAFCRSNNSTSFLSSSWSDSRRYAVRLGVLYAADHHMDE